MKTVTKKTLSKEIVIVAVMIFLSAYIVVDMANYYKQVELNKAFLEVLQLQDKVTESQIEVNQNVQSQIDMIVSILFQMNGGQ